MPDSDHRKQVAAGTPMSHSWGRGQNPSMLEEAKPGQLGMQKPKDNSRTELPVCIDEEKQGLPLVCLWEVLILHD